MNTLENRMSAMADHVAASTLDRKSFVHSLKGATSRLLSGFARAHRNASGSAQMERALDRSRRVSSIRKMRQGFRAELQNANHERSHMAWTLAKELAIFSRALKGVEKSRHTEFARYYRRMASNQRTFLSRDRSARCFAVANMLKHCSESHAQMGHALVRGLKQFASGIEDQALAIRKENQGDLRHFRQAHRAMSRKLHHDLAADASVRRRDIKLLMNRFHMDQGEVRKDIQAAHCVLWRMRQGMASVPPEKSFHARVEAPHDRPIAGQEPLMRKKNSASTQTGKQGHRNADRRTPD